MTFTFCYSSIPLRYLRDILLKSIGFKIGKKSIVHSGLNLITLRGVLEIDEGSIVNPYCLLDTRGGIFIGKNSMIGRSCKLYTAGHSINSSNFHTIKNPIRIYDNVVIFPDCILMPGVIIETGGVLLTGSILTKNIKPYEVWGGNPARKIKERPSSLEYELDNHAAITLI